MASRYSWLCGTASDAVDAVRSAIPKGFKFKKLKTIEFIKKKCSPFFKFETLNLVLIFFQLFDKGLDICLGLLIGDQAKIIQIGIDN